MKLHFDWIDGILIGISFTGGLYLFADSSWFTEHLPAFWLIMYAGRRILFKPRPLPPPKVGIIWRLSSIFGLLLIFVSITLFLMSWHTLKTSKEPMPNFRPEVEKLEQQVQSSLSGISDILNAIKIPKNATEAEIKRRQEEKNKQRLQQREQRLLSRIHKREQKFIQRKEKRYNDGLYLLLWSILMCGFGSFFIRIRYPLSSSTHVTHSEIE